MATVDRRLRPRVVQSSVPDGGGFRIVFQGCHHSVWFAAKPTGRTAHCAVCVNELVEELRASRPIELLSPREFQVTYATRLLDVERDADVLSANSFRRRYGMWPKEARERLRELRNDASENRDGTPSTQSTMKWLLLSWWPVVR